MGEFLRYGLDQQKIVYDKLTELLKDNNEYTVDMSPEGSRRDMVDKIDITITHTPSKVWWYIEKPFSKEYKYDVKASTKPDSVSYTYLLSNGKKSKIYSQDFSVDLILYFINDPNLYFIKASDFYEYLCQKIKSNNTMLSYYNNSKYIWIDKCDAIEMARKYSF